MYNLQKLPIFAPRLILVRKGNWIVPFFRALIKLNSCTAIDFAEQKWDTVVETQLTALLTQKFEEEDFRDCFLVDVKLSPSKKLEVLVDTDSGITLDRCKKISRWLEAHLDESGWLGDTYALEVSSPGVGRPLKLVRQFRQNIGRNIETSMKSGELQSGKLIAVGDDDFTIEYEVKVKEGKKNKKEIIQTVIPFGEVTKTIVKISF